MMRLTCANFFVILLFPISTILIIIYTYKYYDNIIKLVFMRKRLITKLKTPPKPKPKSIVSFFQEDSEMLMEDPVKVNISFCKTKIGRILDNLMATSQEAQSAVMIASQISLGFRMMVLNRNTKQWIGSNADCPDFVECLNPVILGGKQPVEGVQENISFPFIETTIDRYNIIDVEYWDRDNQQVRRTLEGWEAKLFQQGYAMIVGSHIIDWRLNHGRLRIKDEVHTHLPKSTELCDIYSSELQSLFKEYPQLITVPACANQEWFLYDSPPISLQSDFIIRLHKHYKKEMCILMEKIRNGLIS